jgi:hypothetical protein
MTTANHPTSSFAYRLEKIESKLDGGGGGSNNGGMEARVAKLEAIAEASDRRLTQIEGDLRELFRLTLGGFILTWGGIIALGLLILNK